MNVHAGARAALIETVLDVKLAAVDRLWSAWQTGMTGVSDQYDDPDPVAEAGRPPCPELKSPREMPHRSPGTRDGHAALIHSLCHIEFTAINLALDAVYRFTAMPPEFHADWLCIAAEEALHFRLLREHLRGLGHDYGDYPAHGGLWEAARLTAHDPLARMAVIPRYFEARGLDVTPGIQAKLRACGDQAGADILDIILRDEVGHVRAGDRWFRHLCAQRNLAPGPAWRRELATARLPLPRGPFNALSRAEAGFPVEELEQ